MRLPFTALALTSLTFAAAAQPAAPADSTTTVRRASTPPLTSLRAPAEAGKPKQFTILPIPVIFYQAETGFGYGLGGFLSGRFSADRAVAEYAREVWGVAPVPVKMG